MMHWLAAVVLAIGILPAFAEATTIPRYLAASTGVYVWVQDANLNSTLYRITSPGQPTQLTTLPTSVIKDMAEINGVVVTEVLANTKVGIIRTDGTPGGTYALPGLDIIQIFDQLGAAQLNGYVYFYNLDPVTKVSLWRTDGTTAEAVMNLTDASIYYPYGLQSIDGQLYLRTVNDNTLPAIWTSNGQAGSLTLLTTMPLAALSWGGQSWLVKLGSTLDFAMIGPGKGTTLFQVPVSGGPPLQLAQVGGSTVAYTDGVTVSGAKIYFRLWQADGGYGLWASDGTPAGTGLAKDLSLGRLSFSPRDFTSFNNLCYFLADNNPASFPSGFFSSDGTPAGTVPVYNPRGPGKLVGLRQVNNSMYFFAPDGRGGLHLAISDGTLAGTTPSHITPQGFSGNGLNDVWIQAAGGYYYFNYVTTDNSLYRTDGTAAGTVVLGRF